MLTKWDDIDFLRIHFLKKVNYSKKVIKSIQLITLNNYIRMQTNKMTSL